VSEELPHDEELRSLYRKLPADEPRAEVDEAILAAAREVAEAAAREAAAREVAEAAARKVAARESAARDDGEDAHAQQRRRFLARAAWIVPLATAASVILTVSLTRLSPERSDVETSRLHESADSAVGRQGAAPAEHDEAWPEESPRPAPPPASAATAKTAEPAKPKAEAAQPAVEAMEARRRADEKKASGAAARSAGEALARKKAADESQAKSAPADAAKSSDTASDTAADTAAAMAPEKESAEVGGAPPPAAAPASPPLAALADRDDGRSAAMQRPEAGARIVKPDEPGQQRNQAASTAWPFGLAPGLDAAEACRRLESALESTCRFEGSEAVVSPKKLAVADRGEFVGRRITRVMLVATGGRLVEIRLQVEGFTTEQVLVAPAP
jgi:hypothetical protein